MDTHVEKNSHKSLKFCVDGDALAVTPESSGRGLSHCTYSIFTYIYFYVTAICAAKMPLAITSFHFSFK